jgi:hypothetical protein
MPFSQNGKSDMFWNSPWDLQAAIQGCQQQWKVTPRPYWPSIHYGGKDRWREERVIRERETGRGERREKESSKYFRWRYERA